MEKKTLEALQAASKFEEDGRTLAIRFTHSTARSSVF
jgi:hypothetical protein